MGGFLITDFAGMVPRTSARLLTNAQAQKALGARLLSGELEAFKDLSFVVTPGKTGTKLTIYRYGQDITDEALYWFHWLADVDVVRGLVNDDTSERTYWTGETEPRVTDNSIALVTPSDDLLLEADILVLADDDHKLILADHRLTFPNAWYKLGIPKPAAAPDVAAAGGGSGDPHTMAVIYTFVSAWGEEGPPSDASDLLDIKDGDTLTVSSLSANPGAGYNIATKRIYIANTGTSSTDYQFWGEIPLSTVSQDGVLTFSNLAEVIPSKTWFPPDTGLKGLTSIGNGMLAGFTNNDVWFCEPYLPHAWPPGYRKSLSHGVVGLGAFGSTLVIPTTGHLYAGSATDPTSFVPQKLADGQACVSKRGIVGLPGMVMYPSASGLNMVSANGWGLATDALMTREQWQALNPASINGYRLGARYVGFYDTGSVQQGFIFDPNDQRSGFIYIDTYATAGYNDPKRDALYLQVGNDIKRWEGGDISHAYTWRSKVFSVPQPMNPACAQVVAQTYPVTFKLYADGNLKFNKSVLNAEIFKLPAGYQARDFEVQLEGTASVRGVAVGESVEELKGLVT